MVASAGIPVKNCTRKESEVIVLTGGRNLLGMIYFTNYRQTVLYFPRVNNNRAGLF